MTTSRQIMHGIQMLPYRDLDLPYEAGKGYGIFIQLPQGNLNIGAILEITQEMFQVNLMSIPGVELPGFDPFDFSQMYPSLQEAINATREFLESKKIISDKLRAAARKLTEVFISQNPGKPYLVYVALDTHRRLSKQNGMPELARALQIEIDEFCEKHQVQKDKS